MRPLLKNIEDEEAWSIDSLNNSIISTNTVSPSYTLESINISNLMLREKELKRRIAESTQQYAFNFDNVFGPTHTSNDVYLKIGRPLLEGLLDGYNGSLFVYG